MTEREKMLACPVCGNIRPDLCGAPSKCPRTPAPADGEALREALMNIAALTPETNANRNCTCTSCEARRIALAALTLTHAPAPASEGVRDQAFKTAEILESDVIINRDYRSFLAKQLRAALAPEPADGEDHLGERR